MIYISEDIHKKLISYCRGLLPYEACGLLAGHMEGENVHIKKLYPMENTEKSKTHFSMNPKAQIEAAKDMRSLKYELVAIFHSHPDSEAYPSDEDLRLSNDENVSHLIVSLKHKPYTKAFKIKNDKTVIIEKLAVGHNNNTEGIK